MCKIYTLYRRGPGALSSLGYRDGGWERKMLELGRSTALGTFDSDSEGKQRAEQLLREDPSAVFVVCDEDLNILAEAMDLPVQQALSKKRRRRSRCVVNFVFSGSACLMLWAWGHWTSAIALVLACAGVSAGFGLLTLMFNEIEALVLALVLACLISMFVPVLQKIRERQRRISPDHPSVEKSESPR